MPIITIIMPTYKRHRWMRLAIESVLAQGVADWRLHVVNDGQDEDKRKIVEGYGDNRIQYSETEPARCFGNPQRQYAIERVDTPWVGFLDDDDILNKRYLEILLSDQNREAEMIRFCMVMGVMCTARKHYPQIVEKATRMFSQGVIELPQYQHWIPCLESTEEFDKSGLIGTGSFILKRELIQKHGWSRENHQFSDWFSIEAILSEKPVTVRTNHCLYLALRRSME